MKIIPVGKIINGQAQPEHPLWSLDWIRREGRNIYSINPYTLGLDEETIPIVLVVGDVKSNLKISDYIKEEILKNKDYNYLLCFIDDSDAIKYVFDKSIAPEQVYIL